MPQNLLFPLKIRTWCAGNLGGADNSGTAILENGEPCLIKENSSDSPWLCANEWLCNHLASACSVPASSVRVVDMEDGHYAIGIRLDGDTQVDLTASDILDQQTKRITLKNQPEVSRIAFFDAIIKNKDRHLNNYLIRKTVLGHSIVAIDYSRALFFNGFPPPDFHAVKDSKTGQTWQFIGMENQAYQQWISIKELKTVAENMNKIPAPWLETILNSMPYEWLDDTLRHSISAWFESGRIDSTDLIMQGFMLEALSEI